MPTIGNRTQFEIVYRNSASCPLFGAVAHDALDDLNAAPLANESWRTPTNVGGRVAS
jgi:hypothetical protein